MKTYNPDRKAFIYEGSITALAPVTKDRIRVPIKPPGWFGWRGISGIVSFAAGGAPVAEQIFINIFDEATGRNMSSLPISIDGIVPGLARLSSFAAGTAGFVFRVPFYFPVNRILPGGSSITIEVDNRNIAGTGAATVRFALHGEKIMNLATKEQSPGKTFTPFLYVADFGTLVASSQQTQTVAVQPDADFDIVGITGSWNLINSAPNRVLMEIKDLASGYLFQSARLPAHHYIGAPHFQYRPVRPIRVTRAQGIDITLQETTAVDLTLTQVVLIGYKVWA